MQNLNEVDKSFKSIYETLLNNLDESVHIVDKEMNLAFINKALEDFSLGKAKQSAIKGMNLYTIFPFLKEKGIDKEYEKVFSTGEPLLTEEWTAYQGEDVCTITKKIPIKDKKGDVTHIITIMRNLTETKAAEKSLKESEVRYKALFERSLHCVYIHDFEGNFLDANETALNLLGYKKEEIEYITIASLIQKDQFPIALKAIDEIKRIGSQKRPVEYKLRRKDGKFVWVETEGCLIYKDGKPYAILGIAHDITERKKADNALLESEEKYRTLVGNLNVGIYRNTPGSKGRFIEANPSIIKMFGYTTKEEFLTLNVSDLYQNPGDRKKFNEKILKNGFVKNEELQLRKKREKSFWASVTAIAVHDENGKVKYYDGIIEDITRRKQAEEALRKNQERLNNFMNSATDAFAVFDSELNLVEVNKVGLKMFPAGTKKEYVLGKNITELYPNIREKDRYDKYLDVIKSGKSFFVDDVVLHPTFGDMHVAVSAFRVDDGLGIIATDITKAKKMEVAIKESEERYRSVVENANDAIYVITSEGFRYVNPAFEKLTRCKANEICSKKFNFWEVIHPDDVKLIKEREEARKRKEKIPSRYVFRIMAKDGKTKTVEATTVDMGKKGEVKVMGILRDITRRIEAEEEVQRQKKYFQALFNSSPEAIVSLDKAHRVVAINPAFEKLFGYSSDELKGKDIDDYILPKHLEKEGRGYAKIVLNGKLLAAESIRALKDGSRRSVSILGAPVFINGDQIGVFGIYRDITEKKLAEDEVRRALEEERKFKTEAAHYFFNPLAIAKGYLDLLMEEADEIYKNKLKAIYHAVDRVESVVKNVVTKGEIYE